MNIMYFLVIINAVLVISSSGEENKTSDRFQPLPQVDNTLCTKLPECDPNMKYRTIDGSCSNLKHPAWGQAGQPYLRNMAAKYEDGVDKPRLSKEGQPLPNVRKLSSTLFPDQSVPDECNTFNLMQWGQVIAHDITHFVSRQTSGQCCTSDNKVPSTLPDGCMPTEVPADDAFYSQFKVTCLPFTRLAFNNTGACHQSPIEQVNSATSTIDGSLLYGSDDATARRMRSFTCGKLNTMVLKDGRVFLPNATKPAIPCQNSPTENVCFDAGDSRVNQNSGITVYTIALLRLHNQLCDKLHAINPGWDDERLYQESRRIVAAFMNHITFKKFLPPILGKEYMMKKGLMVDSEGDCSKVYDPDINPSTLAEFASAAYRSFHSLVPRFVWLIDHAYLSISHIVMEENFFRPSYIQKPQVLDNMIRGMVSKEQESADQYVTKGLTEFLFKKPDKSFGSDLESNDIVRGRDVGLPTYNDMRNLCGMKKAVTFDDFKDVMNEESVTKLKNFYSCVDDVDLFTGGMMETIIPGTLVGPTFQCIVGEQFYHYMRGDSFYYENCGLPSSFSKDQLKAIYKLSVAWLFCETGDAVDLIQQETFYKYSAQASNVNPRVPCSKIPGLDLSAWKEKLE